MEFGAGSAVCGVSCDLCSCVGVRQQIIVNNRYGIAICAVTTVCSRVCEWKRRVCWFTAFVVTRCANSGGYVHVTNLFGEISVKFSGN